MGQTTFEAPNAAYPQQLENDLRSLRTVDARGLQVYGRNGGSFVLYARALADQERSAVQARIAAHVPDHSETQREARVRDLARQLRQAHADWATLTNAQKDAALKGLIEFTLKGFRELSETG